MATTVHVADDHSVFRAGLRALIEKEKDFLVTGESGNSFDTMKSVIKDKPDVLILDINMPGISTSNVVENLTKEMPNLAILVLTIHDEEYYLKEFLKAGARGFMVKTSTSQELIRALHIVVKGETYVDPALSKHLITNYLGEQTKKSKKDEKLTKRERQVFEKLVYGYTNQEIAKDLTISKRTVDSHRASIMSKLGLNSRAELVRYALQHGLIKPVSPH